METQEDWVKKYTQMVEAYESPETRRFKRMPDNKEWDLAPILSFFWYLLLLAIGLGALFVLVKFVQLAWEA